jgi:hypothetical protein
MFSFDSWKPVALLLAILALAGTIFVQVFKLPDLPAPFFLLFSTLFLLGVVVKQLISLHMTFPDKAPSPSENPAKILTTPLENNICRISPGGAPEA